jgi:predicted alpha/beta-fold hydrolase
MTVRPPRTVSHLDFQPVPWLRNRHLQTLAPFLWPRGPEESPVDERVVRVASGSAVAVRVGAPLAGTRGSLLLVHGISGSASSRYMRRTARLAREAGWWTARMNCRNAGGTERLSSTLFNAGQSDDIGRVLEAFESWGLPRPYAAVGFSLGGNMVLRYAALAGEGSRADGVAALNPPVELATCSRALEDPGNRAYGLYFTVELCRQLERIRRHREVPGPPAAWRKIRTVRNFDELFVAPDAGYPSAAAYYAAASAGPRLGGLRVPALVLSAADDPFVPAKLFEPLRGVAPGRLEIVRPSRGGHLGYWQSARPRFWAAVVVLDYFDRVLDGRPVGAAGSGRDTGGGSDRLRGPIPGPA